MRRSLPSVWVLLLGSACASDSFRPDSGPMRGHIPVEELAPRTGAHERMHLGGEGWREIGPVGNEAALVSEGPLVTPSRPFSDLLVSWNVALDPGAGFEMELRVFEGEQASPWLFLGSFGAGDARTRTRRQSFAGGRVDVDVFTGEVGHCFESAQLRLLTLGDVRPVRTSYCFTLRGSEQALPEDGDALSLPEAVRELAVPARSQRSEDPAIADRICSPTSLAMVLAQHGVERSTAEVARLAYDPHFDLYGNWPRAAQTAFSLGVPAFVTRFEGWAQVERLVARGQPVILSLRVGEGELGGAPYAATSGHLIVVLGFEPSGDVVVNDPAASTVEGVRRVYDRGELGRAWLGHGGVVYVLGQP